MNEVQLFVKERDEALFSLDREKILAFGKKYDIDMSGSETVFWAAIYKSICALKTAPDNLIRQAREWLSAHDMSTEL